MDRARPQGSNSSIPAAPHDDWPATWTPSVLAEHSAECVAKQPAFAKMAALTQLLRANRDDTRLPLARAAWKAHRKQQRVAIEAAYPDLKCGSPKLVIKSIDDPALPSPGRGGRKDDRLERWRDGVARAPWVEECVNILGDMAK